jgi:hypothetical protein
MNKIGIDYSKLGNLLLVTFDVGGFKYCLASPPLLNEDYDELFKILALRVPDVSNVNRHIKVNKDASALIWKDLLDLNYNRIHDLESVFNQRTLDESLRAFKIRHKKTGAYSKGGSGGSFNWARKGKTWNLLGHLKAHFSSIKKQNPDMPDYKDAEIVELGERRAVDIKDFEDLIENER